ncbi:MAG TPA: hypothetical protein VLK84_22325 [Longimicrobium sp.]|nr:hypothetical protein [Longimicrobium sp.]
MPTTPAVPRPVRIAALLFIVYGVMVLGNALVLQTAGGWADAGEFPRALLRLAGCAVIAWGLLRGDRWAWWMGVIFAGLWAALGGVALLVIARLGAWEKMPLGGFSAPFLVLSLLMTGAALALLLQPASRDAFVDAGR